MDGELQPLKQWLPALSGAYNLIDDIVPDDVVLDYSADSLAKPGDVLWDYDEVPGFEEAAAAYVGQVLLMPAGGRWGWDAEPTVDDDGGQPLVCPSDELGLAPVPPMELVAAGGTAIVEKYAE